MSKGVASRFGKDNETFQEEIKRNEHDIQRATSIVGFKEFEVFDLPDNEFDTVSLLSVVKIIEQQINFFKPKEKQPIMIENLRNIFYKMDLSDKETRILSSVFASLGKKR